MAELTSRSWITEQVCPDTSASAVTDSKQHFGAEIHLVRLLQTWLARGESE
jgi:hypothetical protein